ncbi:peroxidase family protein [Pseudahrensia aquimaris]|uniref:Peroxidase family protein n=1 Tax=Pseudahrensia aquimaris TaxID=744461 RepID=A0ABW3FGY4_9HYPH
MTGKINWFDMQFMFDNIIFGDSPPQGTDPFSLQGIRALDGANNNLLDQTIVDQHGQVVHTDTFGLLDQKFFHLSGSTSDLAYDAPAIAAPFIIDSSPRTVSNLIADVDQPTGNPLNAGDPANDVLPFNSLFTFFGQFFDHGLDFVRKGGNGTVAIEILPGDDLYVEGGLNMMFLSRASVDANGDAENSTAPFIEQSQTYGSRAETTFYLKEYENGVATGDLVGGEDGMATWADIKANALGWAVAKAIEEGGPIPTEMLLDEHVLNIPNHAMWDVATASFLPGAETGQPFLADIAHSANPADSMGASLTADIDSDVGNPQVAGEFDNELLEAHFIAGDGRVNENTALTSIHEVFHNEHSRLLSQIKDFVAQQEILTPGFAAQWDGDMYFQAAKLANEMQYQHMVFEEFGRRMSPNIDEFNSYDVNINPNISSEFADAVYRLGHSMLTDNVKATDALGAVTDNTLVDAFLNPILFSNIGGADFLKGAQQEQGAEIDEFVVDGLRNFLVGLQLDLASLNIARGRDTGIGSLNQVRSDLFAQTGEASLEEYHSWDEFGANLLNPTSLVNFIAAYSHDADITDARNGTGIYFNAVDNREEPDLDAARLLAQDKIDNDAAFMGIGGDQGFWDIDLWMGGLAEQKVPLGMLGSTFDFIFAQQMIALQDGDRFYYLARLGGTNMLDEIESQTFADMISRATGATHLNGDAFGFTDVLTELSSLQIDDLIKTPSQLLDLVHEVIGGNNNNNTIQGGAGNDTIYGEGGIDMLNGGANDDHVYGGDGDDFIYGEVGFDFLRGDAGDDQIHGGADDDAISGGDGDDLIYGDQGFDAILGNAGDDTIFGGNQDDEILGGLGNDTLYGDNGADGIDGGDGNDVIYGGNGDDRMFGGDGDNLMIGGAGADQIDGGVGGYDIASYETYRDSFVSGTVPGLTVDMLDPALSTGDARDDQFGDIEVIRGSIHNDQLLGDDVDNVLVGGQGDDDLTGRLGNDTMIGGEGDDSILGGAGIDTALFRGNFADFVLDPAVGGVTVTDMNVADGDEGSDFVANDVELLSFDDLILDLTTGQNVPLIDLSDTHTRMQNGTEVIGELEADVDLVDGTVVGGAGIQVADILIADPDGPNGVRTLAVVGRDAAAFDIVNTPGGPALFFIGGGALSAVNYDIKPMYQVTVNVTDASGTSAVNLTVNVQDVNDNASVFTSGDRVNINEVSQNMPVSIAHEVLYRPTMDDMDTTGDTIVYTLAGPDADQFTLINGELRFDGTSPNYEDPQDADGDNVYDVVIEASDGVHPTVTKALSVHVMDIMGSINGTPGEDDLVGNSGNDAIYAFESNDDVEGAGGDGADTAHYTGAISDYSFNIVDTDGTLQVIDNRPGSPDGTDLLQNVELFEFDGTPGTSPAVALFSNAPVVPNEPADLGALAEDSPVLIINSTDLVNGSFDINGDALNVTDVSVPAGKGTISFVSSSGGIDFYSYQPAADDDTDVVISYSVTDGANTTPYSAVLDLTPVNDDPVANGDTLMATENTAVTFAAIDLLGNDADIDGDTLTISSVMSVTGGTAVLNGDGSVTFTPTPAFFGVAGFVYTANDGTVDSPPATVVVNVAPVNDPPVANDDTLTATEDTPTMFAAIDLLGNDTDAEMDPLEISSVTSGAGATVMLNLDGSIAFNPEADVNGPVTFTYAAFDGTSHSAEATVTINVAAVSDGTVITGDTTNTVEEESGVVSIGDLDADDLDPEDADDVWNAAVVTQGTYGTLSINASGEWVYSLDNSNAAVNELNGGEVLQDTITVEAADGTQQIITLDINGALEVVTGTPFADGLHGSQFGDAIYGMESNDLLSGHGGHDEIYGNADDDTLHGGLGNDILDGGTGLDTMYGGLGNDIYFVDHADDVVTELAGEGADRIFVDGVASITVADNIERLTFLDGGNHVARGNAGDNRIEGNAGMDKFVIDAGGADIFSGGSGRDTFDARSSLIGLELHLEDQSLNAGAVQDDTFGSMETYVGSSTASDFMMAGDGRARFAGSGGDDMLIGGAQHDYIQGDAGNDMLFGGGLRDVLIGGTGDDDLTGGSDRDNFRFINAGFGQDTIHDYEDGLDYLRIFSAVADELSDFTITGNGTSSVLMTLNADPLNTITLNGAGGASVFIDDGDLQFY